MDYRVLDRKAEELRTAGAELAAKGEGVTPEERDTLMKITGELNQLDELRVQARDDEIEEARRIAEHGATIGGGETPEDAAGKAFRSWIKSGTEDRTALVAGTDGNGGYIVPEPTHGPLIEKYRKVSPLLNECAFFSLNGDTTMFLPRKLTHGVVANATETGARSEQTEPTFSNISLVAYDYYSDQRATQQFLDSADGAEDMMMNWIYEDFAETFNADIAVGSGSGKAKGIYDYSGTHYTRLLSGTSNALNNPCWATTMFSLPQKYRPNAKWYMSPATLAVAMAYALPASANWPLVETRPDGFYIYGKKVVEVDDAPAIGDGLYPVAFGDLSKGYAVGVHKAVSILRDPYTATPNVRFYSIARMGGLPWDPDAVLLLKSDDA